MHTATRRRAAHKPADCRHVGRLHTAGPAGSCTLPPPLAVEKGGFAATQPARPSGCAACGGRRALAFRARPWWHVVIVRWRCSTAHLSPAL